MVKHFFCLHILTYIVGPFFHALSSLFPSAFMRCCCSSGLLLDRTLLFQFFPSFVVAAIVHSLSHVRLFASPWTAALQASLSFTITWSFLKLMVLVMLSNHITLCCPLLLLPSVFPSIRVFSNELALHFRWPKYWSFSFSISPSNEYSELISLALILLCGPTLTTVYDNWKNHTFG